MGAGARLTGWVIVVALGASLAACGSSSSKSAPAKSPGSSTSTTAGKPRSGGASVTVGPVHASFRGANHDPVAGKPWSYSVHVTDASGHPLSGKVRIQFTFGGQVVGTDHPPVHPIHNGLWHDTLTFPAAAVGQSVVLQAVVQTGARSITLNWPIKARK